MISSSSQKELGYPIFRVMQSETQQLVRKSFLLGIASILCGITALPAIILSVKSLVRLRKESANKAAWRKVIFSLTFSSCVLAFIVFSIVSVLSATHAYADRGSCINNIKQLGLAVLVYANEHDDTLPSAQWCDVILTNKASSNFAIDIAKAFQCRKAPTKQRSSYAMNRNLVGIKHTEQLMEDTVLLFESGLGWNAIGGPEIAARRHFERLNVVLLDGSVQEVRFEDLGNLRWNPYTNTNASAK